MLRNSWMPIAVVLAANAAGVHHCYGTVHSLGLNMPQTLCSFQAFSQLKEANFQAAAAEATFRSAQQNLLLRVAQADIPLVSPDPESADDWVMSARQDNFDVRSAQLKMEAASRDVCVKRGRGLPTFSLTGGSSKLTQDEVLGGNQTLDTVGISFSWPLFQGGAVASAVRQSRRRGLERHSGLALYAGQSKSVGVSGCSA